MNPPAIRTSIVIPDAGLVVLEHESLFWALVHLKSAVALGADKATIKLEKLDVPETFKDLHRAPRGVTD